MDIEENINLNDIIQNQMKKIGYGTFGDVFSAPIKNTNKKIAIKRINKKKLYESGDNHAQYLIQAFSKELECMRKCNCENSVRFIRSEETRNNYNIIMELCDGDLADVLYRRTEGFKAEEIKIIMSQLNNAFIKLRENHIIHRDLKLKNIFIKYTDESKTKFIPKLGDYGLSKELEEDVAKTYAGTPLTMAPEILNHKSYNEKVDLWSIGVILYQLHFKEYPYSGKGENIILEKILNNTPFKQPENPQLRDLINKLLVVNPEKRLSWEEYFNHPFFASNNQASSTSSNLNNLTKNQRYVKKKEFDVGIRRIEYKCYIADDMKKGKKVFIKSFSKEFSKVHNIIFKTEIHLAKAFKGNERVLQLINIYSEEVDKTTNLVYDYMDLEILPSYLTHHDLTEKELRLINKDLIENIFIFNECNFKSFIFISVYSFAMTKEGKPILFDFGLSKLLLSPDELSSYYISNKLEIGNSSNPTKTNIMNYGITLLKCFYRKKLKIKINEDSNSLDLPKNKPLSKNFCSFLSQSLCKNISERSTWQNLYNHPFVKEIVIDNPPLYQKKSEELILFDKDKLSIIIESMDQKFRLINEYYSSMQFSQKTEYIREIEIFLMLVLYEELMILKIFDRKENEPFNSKQEISFISIKRDKETFSNKININFSNPILSNMKIFQISNNELITNFIIKLKKYIIDLKKISLKVHEITRSDIAKENYESFLGKFIEILEKSYFHNYFFSLAKYAHTCFNEVEYEKAYKTIIIAIYICEYILFIKASLYEKIEEKIYFDSKELLKQFYEIFEYKKKKVIEISPLNIDKERDSYILISFLGVLFRYFKNLMDINEYTLKQNKSQLDGLYIFYPSLIHLLVEIKEQMKIK